VTALRTPSRGPATAGLPPAATLRGVRLGPAGRPALRGVDVVLAAGERLALLGPEGAGKTALLNLLAGFARPSAGEVLLDGRPAAALPPHRRGLGLVLPGDGPLAHLTVAGTIGFALAARGGTGGKPAVGAILQAWGLAGLADRRAHDLSPEQRVRAALARALAGRPRLVLLDDPFAAIGPTAREAVLDDLLGALAAGGAACVLATRDPALALAFGGKCAVLEGGALLQSGPVQMLYDAPATVRVGCLLGEANCLPGQVEQVEDGMALVRLDCGLRVEAEAAEAALRGRSCVIFVRPERIAVAAGTSAEMGEGALPGLVTALGWRGDHVRLTLALGEQTPARLVVKRPAGGPLAGMEPGQAVAIAWQARHARVLPVSGGA
jgi:ABC-type Fe3+/spermidine/putrescine transport system ATPase subunit